MFGRRLGRDGHTRRLSDLRVLQSRTTARIPEGQLKAKECMTDRSAAAHDLPARALLAHTKGDYVSVMRQELGETFLELMQDVARLHLK